MSKILVIGAHVDDESFGMLGTLIKHKEAGDTLFFLWFTEARETELGRHKLLDFFNPTLSNVRYFQDQQLDAYPIKRFITVIEEFINEIKPDVVYTNFIGDLNKDHRLVSEATMVACRPYKEHAPKEVWMYRIPGSTELGLREFKPDRTELIDSSKKLELLLKWYPDELINGREVVDEYERFERWPR